MVEIAQLRDGYNRLNTRLVRGAGRLVSGVYRQLGAWREDDVPRFLEIVEPQLEGLKQQAANLQAVYYQQVAEAQGQAFQAVPASAQDLTEQTLRNGPSLLDVYRRPFVSTWTSLAKGDFVSTAIEQGAIRAASLAETDVQLASRQAGLNQRTGNSNIVGYRRVLTGAENCALCAIASTQRYTRGQLKPIHPGCDCGEEPIYGDFDPGQVVDMEGLDSLHEGLIDQLGVSDRRARSAGIGKSVQYEDSERLADFTDIVVTREHGEYGPTLSWRNQDFTGPEDF